MIYIHKTEIEVFSQVCAELTKNGIAFNAKIVGHQWVIELTGF